MFQDISQKIQQDSIRLKVDDCVIEVPSGYTVAAAMLLQQRRHTRTSSVSGVPRGPFCLMGACFECLVAIDGVSNRQACMTEVAEGMVVSTQRGAGEFQEDGEVLFHEL